MPHTLQSVQSLLQTRGYIADEYVAMSVYLAMKLRKPLLIEGPAGVGKTEIAKVMAKALETELIRLQCYEGLDANHAIYEWNYQHQLLYLKVAESKGQRVARTRKVRSEGDTTRVKDRDMDRWDVRRLMSLHGFLGASASGLRVAKAMFQMPAFWQVSRTRMTCL